MLHWQRCIVSLFALAASAAGTRFVANATGKDAPLVVHLFPNATATNMGVADLENAFEVAYNHFAKTFDFKVC